MLEGNTGEKKKKKKGLSSCDSEHASDWSALEPNIAAAPGILFCFWNKYNDLAENQLPFRNLQQLGCEKMEGTQWNTLTAFLSWLENWT